jgi:hypothetical protein
MRTFSAFVSVSGGSKAVQNHYLTGNFGSLVLIQLRLNIDKSTPAISQKLIEYNKI